jgi:hypothetical protein
MLAALRLHESPPVILSDDLAAAVELPPSSYEDAVQNGVVPQLAKLNILAYDVARQYTTMCALFANKRNQPIQRDRYSKRALGQQIRESTITRLSPASKPANSGLSSQKRSSKRLTRTSLSQWSHTSTKSVSPRERLITTTHMIHVELNLPDRAVDLINVYEAHHSDYRLDRQFQEAISYNAAQNFIGTYTATSLARSVYEHLLVHCGVHPDPEQRYRIMVGDFNADHPNWSGPRAASVRGRDLPKSLQNWASNSSSPRPSLLASELLDPVLEETLS